MAAPELIGALAVLRARAGASQQAACDGLPELIRGLMWRWQLATTGELALAGYGGICLPVLRADATPAMLKVTLTSGERDVENEVLACWGGRHAARLLARDDRRHARLLQRLIGPSLAELADPTAAMSIAGDLAARLAIEPPPGLPRMADLAPEFAARIEETPASRRGPLSDRDVRVAAATFRELGADQPDTLLHGDLQGSNILGSAQGGWAVIDPLGLVGEPALEALTILRDRWSELPGHPTPRAELLGRLHAFADAAVTSRSRVTAWTHARCVRAVLAGVDDDQGMHAWVATHCGPGGG